MALSVKHAFQSEKADSVDTTIVRPSNWNAEHTLQATDGTLLGASGSTTVGEITVGTGLSLSEGTLTATGGGGSGDLGAYVVQDQKSSGTDGGTFTSGAWQTRVINTEVLNSITGASLSSNQITLPAGTYDVIASAPAHQVETHQTRLQNITAGTTTLLGTVERTRATSSTDGSNRSFITGRFTIATSSVFEIQHRCTSTLANTGFGAGSVATWGDVVFTTAMFRKIA